MGLYGGKRLVIVGNRCNVGCSGWAKPIGKNGERVQKEVLADPIELFQLQKISEGLNNGCLSVVQHIVDSRRCHCNHADLLAASISVNSDQITAAMLVQQCVRANIGFSPHRAECSRSASRLYTLSAALLKQQCFSSSSAFIFYSPLVARWPVFTQIKVLSCPPIDVTIFLFKSRRQSAGLRFE